MGDAAAAPPESAGGPANEEEDMEDEEQCHICRLPAEAGRPLRHPCACRGSIRFVHDHCQLRWLDARNNNRCEVCKRAISTCPLYAANAPAILPISEFMVSLPNKLLGLLLPLLLATYVAGNSARHFAAFWSWHIAFATSFDQLFSLLYLRLEPSSVLASVALWVMFTHRVAPSAVAPFARWVARLETWRQGLRRLDVLQFFALFAVEASLTVVIVDMALACMFGFLPFSLGRIILWGSSYLDFVNVDGVESYTSTSYTLRIGYGFIFSLGVCLGGVHTFYHYLRGERLVIILFFRRLPSVFFRGFVHLITVANIGLNLFFMFIIRPLLFGWLLDICSSKMFGATMSERSKLLIDSPFASAALNWLIGCTFMSLRPRLSSIIVLKVLRLGVTFSLVDHDLYEPFYKFYLKKLLRLFVDTIFIALVIVVPIEIADQLAPDVFPLNITYFNRPTKGESVWQGLQNYAVLLSALLLARFLIYNTVIFLEWLVQRAMGYWFVTAGEALGNNVAPKDQYGSSDEAKDKRTSVPVRTMLCVVLAWLTVVIFSSATLFCSISVGRALLPVAGGLKSNDLFSFSVGFGVISTIIGTSRDIFACITSRGPWFLALKRLLLLFVWMVILPLFIGLLVDLSLISPFVGPGDDFPVLDYLCTWSLGWQLKNFWISLAHCTRAAPFLAYFIDERWDGKLNQASALWLSGGVSLRWFFQDIYIPIAMRLLIALGLPYLLAKGCFPILGYSAAVNLTVYRSAWLGSLGFIVISLVETTPFILGRKRHSPRFGQKPGRMPGIHPGSCGAGHVASFEAFTPVRKGPFTPVRGTNRGQCLDVRHVACAGAFVPVRGTNRGECLRPRGPRGAFVPVRGTNRGE